MLETQIPYACGRLDELAGQIRLQSEQLIPLRAVGDMRTLAQLLQQITAALHEAVLLLDEFEAVPAAVYTQQLCAALRGFRLKTPRYDKLVSTLTDWLSYIRPLLPDTENRTVNAAVVGRMMNAVRLGFYPTDPAHVSLLKSALAFPAGKTVNLIDPCCGKGDALKLLAENEQAVTYGAELDDSRAEQAQQQLDRVALGSYYYARISRNVFHVLFLNPPYLQLHGGARSEKRFLGESYDHLMMGGLLIYIVPYHRLTEDVCAFLAAHFSDLTIFRFLGKEFEKFRQVAVIGRRKPRREDRRTAALLSAASFQPERIPPLSNIVPHSYALPDEERSVPLFQGAKFNVRELSEQMRLLGSILPKQSALDKREKRPPLPLTIGQIGLVGGSGLINGLIECETPHVIKGRVIKEKRSYTADVIEEHDGSKTTEIVETTSNKMVFNLLTPDGVKLLT